MAGSSIGGVATTNASSLVNDTRLIKLCETEAYINARSLWSAVQTFVSSHKSSSLNPEFCRQLCEQYIQHFQEFFIQQVGQSDCASSHHDALLDGIKNINAVPSENDILSNNFGHLASHGEAQLLRRAQSTSTSLISNGFARNTVNSSMHDVFQGSVASAHKPRRMSADDIALAHRNGGIENNRLDLSKKKSFSMKRTLSRRNSAKDSEKFRLSEELLHSKETTDISAKSNIVTSMFSRLRRGSKAGTPNQKTIEESITKLDVVAGFLHIPPNQLTTDFSFQQGKIILQQTGEDYILEVHIPPKSSKPKFTISGSEITEVRPTTALEIPEVADSVVIKASGEDYVVKLNRHMDFATFMSAFEWLNMRTGHKFHAYDCHKHPFLPERLRESPTGNLETEPMFPDDCGQEISDESITPPNYRPMLSSEASVSENGDCPLPVQLGSWDNAPELAGSGAPSPPDDGEETEHPRTAPNLNRFPWYHGNLSRNDAAKMVQGAVHGVFLLRRSETRPSTYVLTFNVNRRAKHLRMVLKDDGGCVVQCVTYSSIFDMLQHFRKNPIPLECGTSQVTLTDYVVNENAESQPSANDDLSAARANSGNDDVPSSTASENIEPHAGEASSAGNPTSSGFGSSRTLGNRALNIAGSNAAGLQESLSRSCLPSRAVDNIYTYT